MAHRQPQVLGGRRRILVVDDERAVCEGIARVLRRERYEVETASDASEAGIKVATFHPDLVILDVVMPGMGGIEICRRIRSAADPDEIKIIILTGFPGDGNREKSLIHGADVFLCKPQSAASLQTHVRELLEV
jgi:two-component system alkaline phosphatase synthesis response regulator PhoP